MTALRVQRASRRGPPESGARTMVKTKKRVPVSKKSAKRGKASVRAARKKKRTGSLARGFHEGSRSEYLAQFVFSSFGRRYPSHIRKTPELISTALCLSQTEK